MVFPDDEWAMAGISALTDAGLSVPGDVSVTGHDDHPLASVFRPGLTTASEPCAKVGEMAFELMTRVLKEPAIDAKLRVESRVVIRGSAGTARK
jgi:LacI family transcriptional regulator